MNSSPLSATRRLVWTSIMAALTAAGAFIQFPLGPVPFSLQTFFVMLSGFILGPAYGPLAMLLYIFAGLLGLPVFSKGGSGLGHVLGPTGGYLAGFLAASLIDGLATRGFRPLSWTRGILIGLCGSLSLFSLGVARLAAVLDIPLSQALAVGYYPFIATDLAKLFMAVGCYRYLQAKKLLPA